MLSDFSSLQSSRARSIRLILMESMVWSISFDGESQVELAVSFSSAVRRLASWDSKVGTSLFVSCSSLFFVLASRKRDLHRATIIRTALSWCRCLTCVVLKETGRKRRDQFRRSRQRVGPLRPTDTDNAELATSTTHDFPLLFSWPIFNDSRSSFVRLVTYYRGSFGLEWAGVVPPPPPPPPSHIVCLWTLLGRS